MKVAGAYLLAQLGGNTSPCADELKNILDSGASLVNVQRNMASIVRHQTLSFDSSIQVRHWSMYKGAWQQLFDIKI